MLNIQDDGIDDGTEWDGKIECTSLTAQEVAELEGIPAAGNTDKSRSHGYAAGTTSAELGTVPSRNRTFRPVAAALPTSKPDSSKQSLSKHTKSVEPTVAKESTATAGCASSAAANGASRLRRAPEQIVHGVYPHHGVLYSTEPTPRAAQIQHGLPSFAPLSRDTRHQLTVPLSVPHLGYGKIGGETQEGAPGPRKIPSSARSLPLLMPPFSGTSIESSTSTDPTPAAISPSITDATSIAASPAVTTPASKTRDHDSQPLHSSSLSDNHPPSMASPLSRLHLDKTPAASTPQNLPTPPDDTLSIQSKPWEGKVSKELHKIALDRACKALPREEFERLTERLKHFGEYMTPEVLWVISEYVNGEIDQWRALGVIKHVHDGNESRKSKKRSRKQQRDAGRRDEVRETLVVASEKLETEKKDGEDRDGAETGIKADNEPAPNVAEPEAHRDVIMEEATQGDASPGRGGEAPMDPLQWNEHLRRAW